MKFPSPLLVAPGFIPPKLLSLYGRNEFRLLISVRTPLSQGNLDGELQSHKQLVYKSLRTKCTAYLDALAVIILHHRVLPAELGKSRYVTEGAFTL